MNLDELRARGFNESRRLGNRVYQVRCDSCEALVINGVPTHERGCPNDMHECAGCNTLIPARQKYCEDCQ